MSVVLFKFKITLIYCLFSLGFCTQPLDTKNLLQSENNHVQAAELNKSHHSLGQIAPPPSKFDENYRSPNSNDNSSSFPNKAKEPEDVSTIIPQFKMPRLINSSKTFPIVVNNSNKYPKLNNTSVTNPKKVEGNAQQSGVFSEITKNQDHVVSVPTAKSDSESKLPVLNGNEEKSKDPMDISGKADDVNNLNEQNNENSKKVEENESIKFNPSYDNGKNDQIVNYNDESYSKDVPPKMLFNNKNAILYDDTNSHFFAYFLTLMVMAVLFYLLFHNKHRVSIGETTMIIALLIEGRRGRSSRRNGARAKYHKLDNNLEEAMNSTRGVGIDGGTNGALGNIY